MSTVHQQVRLLLGAYILGGLDDTDLHAVQEHLPSCPTCRDELSTLAALPALLRRRSEPDLSRLSDATAPPPRLLPTLLRQVTEQRRRDGRRWRLRLAVAAVTLVALGLGAGTLAARELRAPGAPVTAAAQREATFSPAAGSATTGRLQLLAKPWGTAISIELSGLPRSGRFVLQATDAAGAHEQAAAWGATSNGVVRVVGATSWRPDDVTQVAVMSAGGQVLAAARPSPAVSVR